MFNTEPTEILVSLGIDSTDIIVTIQSEFEYKSVALTSDKVKNLIRILEALHDTLSKVASPSPVDFFCSSSGL